MNNFIKKNRLGLLFLLIGIISMIIGYYKGEIIVVITKAVRICLECIGIG